MCCSYLKDLSTGLFWVIGQKNVIIFNLMQNFVNGSAVVTGSQEGGGLIPGLTI